MSNKITLKNVRLSFPSLFQKAMWEGKEGKYEATFLIPKSDKKLVNEINQEIRKKIEDSNLKISKDKICLKDGDETEYDGYDGCIFLKASNNRRPIVINRDKSAISERDEIIYGGCYVNAIVDFWVQNNQYGKRVNANLLGIQFVRDGKPFGSPLADVSDEFEDIEGEDEDFDESDLF